MPTPSTRPLLVTLFRYPLHEHEAMVNPIGDVFRLLADKADVHHFCYSDARRHALQDVPGFHLHSIPGRIHRGHEVSKWFQTILWFGWCVPIALWARFRRARLVYVPESIPFLATWLHLLSGRPLAMNVADLFWDMYLPETPRGKRWKRKLACGEARGWRKLRGIITHTDAFKRHAVSLGVAPERIHLVPEACDVHRFFPAADRASCRARLGIRPTDFVLLFHGILHPNKALDRVLDYLAPLMEEQAHLRFIIIGNGPARPKLENQLAEKPWRTRVEFMGWLPGSKELNDALNACDVSLVMREGRLSDHFQITAALFHSLACGCCILAAKLDGVAEWIHSGENGLLFDPRSPAEFTARLRELMASAELRQRLGQAAAQTARTRMDHKKIAAQWAAVILDLLQEV